MKRYYQLIGLIILGIVLTKIDVRQIVIQFSRLNIGFFLLISLLVLPGLFLKAYRWRCILRLQGIDYSVASSFLAYLGGVFAGIVTPARVGEAAKAAYLKRDKDVPFGRAVASIFVDRLFDIYLLVLVGSIAAFSLLHMKEIKYSGAIWLAAAFVFSVPFVAVNKIMGRRIYLPFILTIGAYLVYFYQCYLLARLAHIDISFMTTISIVSISTLASLAPITVLGIGTREASLVWLFGLCGLKAEGAIVYSFLLFLSFYVYTAVLGYAGWVIKGHPTAKGGYVYSN